LHPDLSQDGNLQYSSIYNDHTDGWDHVSIFGLPASSTFTPG
jgi:hypothetical protein